MCLWNLPSVIAPIVNQINGKVLGFCTTLQIWATTLRNIYPHKVVEILFTQTLVCNFSFNHHGNHRRTGNSINGGGSSGGNAATTSGGAGDSSVLRKTSHQFLAPVMGKKLLSQVRRTKASLRNFMWATPIYIHDYYDNFISFSNHK